MTEVHLILPYYKRKGLLAKVPSGAVICDSRHQSFTKQIEVAASEARRLKGVLMLGGVSFVATKPKLVKLLTDLVQQGLRLGLPNHPEIGTQQVLGYMAVQAALGPQRGTGNGKNRAKTHLLLADINKAKALAEAEKLRPIIADVMKETGLMQYVPLLNELNRRGIKTPSGGRWHMPILHRTLKRTGLARHMCQSSAENAKSKRLFKMIAAAGALAKVDLTKSRKPTNIAP